jgi:hypothetical protein
MSSYAYRPLLLARNGIRLIQILPGFHDADTHCRIVDYIIRDDQVSGLFEALSYAWDDPTETCRIYVLDLQAHAASANAEQYLNITTNLYSAPERLHDPALPRLM